MVAARAVNVLVYAGERPRSPYNSSREHSDDDGAGTGTTAESVRHCLASLRRALYPNYAVIPMEEQTLLREPWAATCALLVVPGGADLGYCRVLDGRGNRLIGQYVRAGGRYLGFCAGGYYGSRRCEFEVGNRDLEVVGPRELAFFPGTCRGAALAGFAYHSERGARAARLLLDRAAPGAAAAVAGRCAADGHALPLLLQRRRPVRRRRLHDRRRRRGAGHLRRRPRRRRRRRRHEAGRHCLLQDRPRRRRAHRPPTRSEWTPSPEVVRCLVAEAEC